MKGVLLVWFVLANTLTSSPPPPFYMHSLWRGPNVDEYEDQVVYKWKPRERSLYLCLESKWKPSPTSILLQCGFPILRGFLTRLRSTKLEWERFHFSYLPIWLPSLHWCFQTWCLWFLELWRRLRLGSLSLLPTSIRGLGNPFLTNHWLTFLDLSKMVVVVETWRKQVEDGRWKVLMCGKMEEFVRIRTMESRPLTLTATHFSIIQYFSSEWSTFIGSNTR